MKRKTTFLAYLSFVSFLSFSQSLFIPSGVTGISATTNLGNIGIGINNPKAKFHVQNLATGFTWNPIPGTVALFESGYGNRSYVSIVGRSTGQSEFWFGDENAQAIGRVRYDHVIDGLEFWTNSKKRMTIDYDGNVSLPVNKRFSLGEPTDLIKRLSFYHDGGNANIEYADNLNFRSIDNMKTITLTKYGEVILGESSSWPKAKLNIVGDGALKNIEWSNNPFMIWSGNRETDYALFAGVSTLDKCAYIQSSNVQVSEAPLSLNFNGGLVTIGKVTDFSKAKDYSLAVAGGILAENVMVKLQGNWPDYVFDDSYALPTLEQMEQHIKENKHLIGVPSAKEVEEKGIDVGEMNAILLKKVEELTLLMIEQNKRLNKLEQENAALKNN